MPHLTYEAPLSLGRLIRRYQRFLAEVELDSGAVVTAHVPNTGSMRSTREPTSRVALSFHGSGGRKLSWTLELVQADSGAWVGVNTMRPNRLVAAAIREGRLAALQGYRELRAEVPYGERSRIDLLLSGHRRRPRCFVEIKNVTKSGSEGRQDGSAVKAFRLFGGNT